MHALREGEAQMYWKAADADAIAEEASIIFFDFVWRTRSLGKKKRFAEVANEKLELKK
jgi:hypothetical protein